MLLSSGRILVLESSTYHLNDTTRFDVLRTSFSTPPLPLSVRFLKLPLFQDFVHIEESKEDIETELESTMNIISSRLLLYVRALTESVPALMADVLNRGKLCYWICVYFQY
jgi:hypothetical protein